MADAIKLAVREESRATKSGKPYHMAVLQDVKLPGVWGTVFVLDDAGIVGFELTPIAGVAGGSEESSAPPVQGPNRPRKNRHS